MISEVQSKMEAIKEAFFRLLGKVYMCRIHLKEGSAALPVTHGSCDPKHAFYSVDPFEICFVSCDQMSGQNGYP